MASQVNIGPKIGVDGEADYRSAMSRVISKTQALKAEMNALKTATVDEADAEKQAELVAKNHAEQLEAQKERVRLLTEQLEKCKTATSENSEETNRYRELLANAKTVLNQMEQETGEATDATEEFTDATEDAGEGATSLGTLITANLISDAIVSGLKALANLAKDAAEALMGAAVDAAAYADEILTMSTVTGLSTEQLQELDYMAELIDVSVSTMTGSMTRLTRSMASARKGSEASAEAFKRLGVRTTNADGTLRDSNEVFFEIIDALGQMEDGSERDALMMEIFGKSAQELNPLIAAGSKGMRQFAEEARAMGYVLDDETLGQLGALDDSLQRFENLKTVMRNRLGAAMAPAMERVIDKLIEFADRVDWDTLGEKLGGLLERIADRLIEFLDGVDLDKLADGAMTLIDGIVNGLSWIVEHADEIVKLAGTLGTMLIGGKVVGAGKNAWTTLSALLSGGAKTAAGGAAAAGSGAAAGGGGAAAAGGGGLSGFLGGGWGALALPLMEVVGLGKGAWDYFGTRREMMAGARLGEDASIEEMRANVERLQGVYDEAKKFYDSRQGELYGEMPDGKWLLSQATAEYDAASAALKAAQDELDAALASTSSSAETAGTAVSGELSGLGADASGWGADMAENFAAGFAAGADGTLIPTVATVAGAIAALLHHSEPDVGPLANDSQWMPDLMRSMAAGIRDYSYLVVGQMEALAGDIGSLMPTAGGTSQTMNMGGVTVVFQVQEGQDGRALFEEFSDWLAQGVYKEGAAFA